MIPRDRYGNFHPQILAVLKNHKEECDRLAGALYSKGLTQSQAGEIFDDIYGEHYSKSSISRMIRYMHKTREVLGIYNNPGESANGCTNDFDVLRISPIQSIEELE